MALGSDLPGSTTTENSWSEIKDNAASYGTTTTAGYSLAENKISYTPESQVTQFSLSGIKATDGINVTDTTVTLTASALNGANVTLTNGEGNNYVLAVDRA